MKLDPSIQVALCSTAETLVNKALQYDPGSRLALARLQGKVLALELINPELNFYFFPEEDGLRVQSTFDGEITTRVKGSPLDLLALAKSPRLNLADSGVEVFGNTGFLIELQNIVQSLDIDWEELVSSVVGDIAGHEIGKASSAVNHWFSQRKQSFNRLMGEFLTEEIKATPSKIELENFYRQVDELRLGVDRASAQLKQLLAKDAELKTDSADRNKDHP